MHWLIYPDRTTDTSFVEHPPASSKISSKYSTPAPASRTTRGTTGAGRARGIPRGGGIPRGTARGRGRGGGVLK
jgi:DASH complex subunit DAM1